MCCYLNVQFQGQRFKLAFSLSLLYLICTCPDHNSMFQLHYNPTISGHHHLLTVFWAVTFVIVVLDCVVLASTNDGGGSQKYVQKCTHEWKQFKNTVYHKGYHKGYSFQPYLIVKSMDIWLNLWYHVVCRWLQLILEQLAAEASRQKIRWKHR